MSKTSSGEIYADAFSNPARIVAVLTFENWDVALETADELRAIDWDVVINEEIVDDDSNAAFAEAYKIVPRVDHETLQNCFQ